MVNRDISHKYSESQSPLEKYLLLTNTLSSQEERLPLWFCMTEDQRLQLLAHEHIDREAEVLTQLIIGKTEQLAGANFKMAELDKKLERALDHQIYEKYRRLTEFQALKTTLQNSEKRLRRLTEEDVDLLQMIKFIHDKEQDLKSTQKYLYKDITKKYKDNSLWRQQYDKKTN